MFWILDNVLQINQRYKDISGEERRITIGFIDKIDELIARAV